MARYDYRCEEDGVFEAAWPVGAAPESVECATCGSRSGRVFSSPMLSFSSRESREVFAAIDHAEKTRDEPDVVTSLPPSSRRTPVLPLTPTLRRLPRP
jgi:hypothetical protein